MQRSKSKNDQKPAPKTAGRKTRSSVKQKRRSAQIRSRALKAVDNPKTNKIETVMVLLRRPHGASIIELCTATGWQAHSVRGAMSGTLKKKFGLTITSTKVDGVRTYRIAK